MEKIIRGLKRLIPDATDWTSQEEKRFIRFFEMVQNEASVLSCVFFFDGIEGHSAEFDNPIDYENITGWMIPKEKADQFETEWETREPSSWWNNYYYEADWEETEKGIVIVFNQLQIL